ncbi:hypothetical protein [Streptomyces sp. OR43]|uniref:hypothetical protein n=1 Tax=Streptomyces sp. or43 TaxID=2478957 RepID=UPI00165193B8|nr:hypothetical protein [Streptomyces sp. or43]
MTTSDGAATRAVVGRIRAEVSDPLAGEKSTYGALPAGADADVPLPAAGLS